MTLDFILTADLGGTNTRLACFRLQKAKDPEYLLGACFSSRQGDFAAQINSLLELAKSKTGAKIGAACFAVAGVISPDGERAEMANLDWPVDCARLRGETPLERIVLLNDFQALGFGSNFLCEEEDEDLRTLAHPGGSYPSGDSQGTRAVIGAGTGLGHGILVYSPAETIHLPIHSEGSHCDLAAVDEREWRLVRFLKQEVCAGAHPEYERAACGPGLVNLYNFFRGPEGVESPASSSIAAASDKGAAVSEHIRDDGACALAMEFFLRFYARAAKNLALTCMSTGGVYLGGGITPQILPLLQTGAFMKEFERADRPGHREVLRRMPVRVIVNPLTAQYGAAAWGARTVQ